MNLSDYQSPPSSVGDGSDGDGVGQGHQHRSSKDHHHYRINTVQRPGSSNNVGYSDMALMGEGSARSATLLQSHHRQELPKEEQWVVQNDQKLLSLKLRQQKLKAQRNSHLVDSSGSVTSSSANGRKILHPNTSSSTADASSSSPIPLSSNCTPVQQRGGATNSRGSSPTLARSGTSPLGHPSFNTHPNPEMDSRHSAKQDAVLNARLRNQLRQTQQRLEDAKVEMSRIMATNTRRGGDISSRRIHTSSRSSAAPSTDQFISEVKDVMDARDQARSNHQRLSSQLQDINEEIMREESTIERRRVQRNASQQTLFDLQREHRLLKEVTGGGHSDPTAEVFTWAPVEQAKRAAIQKHANQVQNRIEGLLEKLQKLEDEKDNLQRERKDERADLDRLSRRLDQQLNPMLARQEREQRELLLQVKAEAIAAAQADVSGGSPSSQANTSMLSEKQSPTMLMDHTINQSPQDARLLKRLVAHRDRLEKWLQMGNTHQ